jgi:two-component system, OmpR family, response regulator CpxR
MQVPPGRILVVEDHDDTRRLLEDVFVLAGFAVQTAENGAEALRQLRRDPPDVIVLDLMLPWVSGVEVLGTMRSDPALAKVPVLVTTATTTSEADLQAFGPLVVIRKPFELNTLVPLVQHLLSGRTSAGVRLKPDSTL